MLRLSGVRKSFGPVIAVDELTLGIRRGEVFGLLGPNGAGKTTTTRTAVGQLRPDAGQIELDGGGAPGSPSRVGSAPPGIP